MVNVEVGFGRRPLRPLASSRQSEAPHVPTRKTLATSLLGDGKTLRIISIGDLSYAIHSNSCFGVYCLPSFSEELGVDCLSD